MTATTHPVARSASETRRTQMALHSNGSATNGSTTTRSARTVENPISGERFVFLETAADTDGDLLAFELTLQPGGRVPGGHVHPGQEERFHVQAGYMRFRKGIRTAVAGPGDTVVVPPETYHRFANAGTEPARVRVEVRPPLEMQRLYETVVALAQEGRTLRSGLPRPLDLALFMREFEDEVEAPIAPGLVRAATAPLAWLGARRGLDARYGSVGGAATRRPVPVRPAGRAPDLRPAAGPSSASRRSRRREGREVPR
jgi:quercetin dioxygenase-like cupin family protein